MRVAVVHGYFLHDSGSAIYTRELSMELARQGHDVTLVCQDQDPESYPFIDSLFDCGPGNERLLKRFERERPHAGSCRMVRPDLGGRLLTYVPGPFAGFEARAFQEAPDGWIAAYLEANVRALRLVFDRWPQDLVQANHAVMQPCAVRRALSGRSPYVATIHGSEINFTIRHDQRMVPYAREGLEGAVAICALSDTSRAEAVDFFRGQGFDIAARTVELPPGVDTRLFQPITDRAPVLASVSSAIDAAGDDIAVFAGRLLWTKGLQHVVAALPLAIVRRPRLQLIAVGEGPMREALAELIEALDRGQLDVARELTETRRELAASHDFGPVLPRMSHEESARYLDAARGNLKRKIHFTGHLEHERLAPLLGAADVFLSPSIFPEAFGMVSIEAMAAGAVPLATYQTGLRTPLDVAAGEIDDPELISLAPGTALTGSLGELIPRLLESLPTRESGFRNRLHGAAAGRFSWSVVAERYLEFAAA